MSESSKIGNPGTSKSKVIVSPGFAMATASRNVPGPLSKLLVTIRISAQSEPVPRDIARTNAFTKTRLHEFAFMAEYWEVPFAGRPGWRPGWRGW